MGASVIDGAALVAIFLLSIALATAIYTKVGDRFR